MREGSRLFPYLAFFHRNEMVNWVGFVRQSFHTIASTSQNSFRRFVKGRLFTDNIVWVGPNVSVPTSSLKEFHCLEVYEICLCSVCIEFHRGCALTFIYHSNIYNKKLLLDFNFGHSFVLVCGCHKNIFAPVHSDSFWYGVSFFYFDSVNVRTRRIRSLAGHRDSQC